MVSQYLGLKRIVDFSWETVLKEKDNMLHLLDFPFPSKFDRSSKQARQHARSFTLLPSQIHVRGEDPPRHGSLRINFHPTSSFLRLKGLGLLRGCDPPVSHLALALRFGC